MSLLWLYRLHPFWLGVLIVGFLVVASLLGLRLTRPLARRLCKGQNDFANYFLATVAVFYAVLVGLIAVASWGNYTTLLTAALSLVIGLVIFLILALDRPLIGYVSIDSSSFEDALTMMGGAI